MTDSTRTPPAPLCIAVAIIRHAGKVLVTRRPDDAHLGGFDEFPGGKVEPGESLEACVVREVREEVGLTVEVIRRLGEERLSAGDHERQIHFFLCRWCDADERLSPSALEPRWIPAGELDPTRFPPTNRRVVGALHEAR